MLPPTKVHGQPELLEVPAALEELLELAPLEDVVVVALALLELAPPVPLEDELDVPLDPLDEDAVVDVPPVPLELELLLPVVVTPDDELVVEVGDPELPVVVLELLLEAAGGEDTQAPSAHAPNATSVIPNRCMIRTPIKLLEFTTEPDPISTLRHRGHPANLRR